MLMMLPKIRLGRTRGGRRTAKEQAPRPIRPGNGRTHSLSEGNVDVTWTPPALGT